RSRTRWISSATTTPPAAASSTMWICMVLPLSGRAPDALRRAAAACAIVLVCVTIRGYSLTRASNMTTPPPREGRRRHVAGTLSGVPRGSLLLAGARGELEGGARGLRLRDADDVAATDERAHPAGDDGDLTTQRRHRVQVVRARHRPGREAADVQLLLAEHQAADALVHAEGREDAEVLVVVVHQRAALDGARDVVGQALSLAHRVLGVGRAELALARGEVRHGGAVAGGEDVVEGAVLAVDAQVGQDLDLAHERAALGDDREIGGLLVEEHRVRLDARVPHEQVGLELVAVAGLDHAVLGGVQEGLELDLDAALAQLVQHVGALVLGELREDEGGAV